jgi:hypothetical protein
MGRRAECPDGDHIGRAVMTPAGGREGEVEVIDVPGFVSDTKGNGRATWAAANQADA